MINVNFCPKFIATQAQENCQIKNKNEHQETEAEANAKHCWKKNANDERTTEAHTQIAHNLYEWCWKTCAMHANFRKIKCANNLNFGRCPAKSTTCFRFNRSAVVSKVTAVANATGNCTFS